MDHEWLDEGQWECSRCEEEVSYSSCCTIHRIQPCCFRCCIDCFLIMINQGYTPEVIIAIYKKEGA